MFRVLRAAAAVALASDGRLFVADYPNGLRVVAPDGRVSSYPIAKREESALLSTVAIVPENGNDYLLASSVTDFYQVDLTHNLLTNDIGVGTPDGKNHVAYGTLVGPPTAIGGILTPTLPGIGTIVFPDAFYSEVVVCYFSNCRFLSSPPRFDASFHGGGYRDGPAPEALFEQPEGIAASRDGTIYVADTGNKRIRRITSVPAMLPGLNYGESILSKFPQVRNPEEYRIAAHLEHRLAPPLAARGKRVEIYPLGIPGIPRDAALSLVIDFYPAFLAEHSKANNHRLFASWDHHFAPYAAALVGDSLGDRIARDAPWSAKP